MAECIGCATVAMVRGSSAIPGGCVVTCDKHPEHSAVSHAPAVMATQYTVCAYPREDIDRLAFEILVEYRGNGRWAVERNGACLNAEGQWGHERIPSEREAEWLATHRFDLPTAIRLAVKVAPTLTCNGATIAQVLAMKEMTHD